MKNRIIGYASLGILLIAIDRIFKLWAIASCTSVKYLVPGVSCELSFNRGIALGLFDHNGTYAFYALTAAVIIITGFLVRYAYKRMLKGYSIIGETLIISGAIGNLIDRFVYGGVIDFIVLSYGTHVFPVFNGADICITVGVLIAVFSAGKT